MLAGLVSVAPLLPSVGSLVPLGGVTVAVLTNCPVVPLGTVPLRRKVAVPPLTRLTVVAMLPVPLAAPQLLGAVALHVQVNPAPCSAAGSGSETTAPVTSLGPLLVTTIVYVNGWPGTYGFGLLVLVIDRSAVMLAGFWLVAVLLARLGSVAPDGAVTVALLTNCPVVPLGTVPLRLKVAVPPLTRLTVVVILPLPPGAPQLLGAVALHVQVNPAPLSAAGSGSETAAPVTSLGPLLVTTIVYVNG